MPASMTFDGVDVVLKKVPYRGQATTYTVDFRTDVVAVVAPASGPTLSLAVSAGARADKTVTVAAGGANKGGYIYVAAAKSAS